MKKFKVRITETLVKDVEIEADSEYEALQIADNNYRKSEAEFILNADNFDSAKMEIVNE